MRDNKSIVKEFLLGLGAGDVEKVRSVIAEDISAVCTGTCVMSSTRNFADVLGAVGMLKQATKNGIDVRILNLTAEDDRVSAEWEGRATLANGTPYNNQYHFLCFVRNGKIYRINEYMDTKLVQECFGPMMAAA
jgi:uncharacterized protein